MKKSSEVLGLKLMGIKEGLENGVAHDFMVNPGTRNVDYLILKNSNDYGFRAIKIGNIKGIGADYIMTESITNAQKMYESKEILEVIENGFFLLGTTVLSSIGDIIGRVVDFTFDEKTGKIDNILLDNGNEFSADRIASLAGQIVFVDFDDEATVATSSAGAVVQEKSAMEQESVDFLLGKTLTNDVVSDDGLFKLDAGTVLTDELISEAEKHDAILTLTLNV